MSLKNYSEDQRQSKQPQKIRLRHELDTIKWRKKSDKYLLYADQVSFSVNYFFTPHNLEGNFITPILQIRKLKLKRFK